MQSQNTMPTLVSFVPLITMSILMAVCSFLLAKEKGRNVLAWTILGAIPFINFACIPFFIGSTNFRLECKLDKILEALNDKKHT